MLPVKLNGRWVEDILKILLSIFIFVIKKDIIIVSTPYLPGSKSPACFFNRLSAFSQDWLVQEFNVLVDLPIDNWPEAGSYISSQPTTPHNQSPRKSDGFYDFIADAMVNVNFEASEIGQTVTELVAYSTAVMVEKD